MLEAGQTGQVYVVRGCVLLWRNSEMVLSLDQQSLLKHYARDAICMSVWHQVLVLQNQPCRVFPIGSFLENEWFFVKRQHYLFSTSERTNLDLNGIHRSNNWLLNFKQPQIQPIPRLIIIVVTTSKQRIRVGFPVVVGSVVSPSKIPMLKPWPFISQNVIKVFTEVIKLKWGY